MSMDAACLQRRGLTCPTFGVHLTLCLDIKNIPPEPPELLTFLGGGRVHYFRYFYTRMKEKIFNDMEAKRKMKKKMKRLLALLAAMVLIVSLIPAAALAADETEEGTSSETTYTVYSENKTITVKALYNADYYTQNTGIRDAINYIYNIASDKENWTITVESGTYLRFEVPESLAGLTVRAADDATVTIPVLDGKNVGYNLFSSDSSSKYSADTKTDMGGIVILGADNVTLRGLTIVAYGDGTLEYTDGSRTSYNWFACAVSDYQSPYSENYSNGLTVDSCEFQGNYSSSGNTHSAILITNSETWTVTNCTFDNWYQGVYFEEEGRNAETIEITNNVFINCNRATDGCLGATPSDNSTFTVTGNTFTGSVSLRTKIILFDQSDYGSLGTLTIKDNTFTNAALLLFDTYNDLASSCSDPFTANTFDDNSYMVKAKESTGEFGFASYYSSPDYQVGYWELEEDDNWSEANLALIIAAINKANAAGSHELNMDIADLYDNYDYSDYIVTCTHFKDAIYWVGTTSEDYPAVEKNVTSASISEDGYVAGELVDFSLTVSVPDYLNIYFEDGESGLYGNDEDKRATERGSYIVTVHDEMDEELELDASSIAVSVGGVWIDSYRYTLTTSDLEDDCVFEISIDLVSLVEAGILTADEDGNYQDIVITYSATVSEDAEADDYENTTWVTYEADGKSDPSTVTVTVSEPEPETEEETTEEETTEEETTVEETTEEETTVEETTEEQTTEEKTTEEETTQTEETEETEEDTPVVGSTGIMIWMILLGAAALCVAVMIARKKIAG